MGHYKTWTLDYGLDCGLDCGLNYGLSFYCLNSSIQCKNEIVHCLLHNKMMDQCNSELYIILIHS